MSKKQEKAKTILEATFRLLNEKRYYEITVDEIAAEARVGKGTIYRYFKDKDTLLIQMAKSAIEHGASFVVGQIGQKTPIREKLLAIANNCYDYLSSNPAVFKIMHEEVELFQQKSGESYSFEHHKPFYEAMCKVLSESVDAGELNSELSIEFMVTMYMGILHEMTFKNYLCPHRNVKFEDGVDFFLKAARPQ